MSNQLSNNPDFKEISSRLIYKIGISGIMKNLALIMYFFSREILMLNWLGLDNARLYGIFAGYLSLFTAFLFITPHLIPRFYQEYDNQSQHYCNKIIQMLTLLNLIFLELVFLIIGYIDSQINFTDLPLHVFMLFIGFTSLFPWLFTIIESGLYGLKAAKEIGYANIGLSGLFLVLLLFIKTYGSLNFYSAIGIYLGANIGGCVIAGILLKKVSISKSISSREGLDEINNLISKEAKNRILHKIIRFAIPLFFANIFYMINYRLGNLMLQNMAGNAVIYYHICINLIILFMALLGLPINDMVYPHLSEAFLTNDIPKITFYYHFTFRLISVLLIGGLIIIYGLSSEIMNLVYPIFYSSELVMIFRIFIVGGIFYCLNQFLGRFPMAKGKTEIVLLAQSVGSLTNFLFLTIAISAGDLIYAAIGFVISSGILTVFYLIFYLKSIQVKFLQTHFGQLFFAISSTLIIFELLTHYIKINFINTFISGIIYIGFLFGLKILPKMTDIQVFSWIQQIFIKPTKD